MRGLLGYIKVNLLPPCEESSLTLIAVYISACITSIVNLETGRSYVTLNGPQAFKSFGRYKWQFSLYCLLYINVGGKYSRRIIMGRSFLAVTRARIVSILAQFT